MIEQFQSVLHNALILACPTDTGRMSTNIFLYDYGDYFSFRVEVFYAVYVNYNRQRTPKEQANYQWVEKTIRRVAEMFGANVTIEIGG